MLENETLFVAPKPKFVLAPPAVVAPLPPLLIAKVPEKDEAGKLVNPEPFPFVARAPIAVRAVAALVAVQNAFRLVLKPSPERPTKALAVQKLSG